MIDPIKKTRDQQLDTSSPSSEIKIGTSQSPYPDEEAEYVMLPSRGVIYKGHFQHLEMLKVRKLNWTDEDVLTTRSYYDNGTLFTEILKNVIVDTNGFKGDQLIAVDRDAILLWLRIGAFGRDYVVPHTCTNSDCGKKTQRVWDLGSFEMPEFNEKYKAELEEFGEVAVTLPESKEVIKISIPTVGRELEVQKRLKSQKEKLKTERDFLITGRLLSVISAVPGADGTELRGLENIHNWIKQNPKTKRNLGLLDSREIQKVSREIEIKIDTKRSFECKHCGFEEGLVEMPMGIMFFWPHGFDENNNEQ